MSYSKKQRKFLQELGLRVRAFREAKGWSQEELAFNSGLHRTYVGDIERGERNIAVLNLSKLAAALEIPIASLFHPDSLNTISEIR